VDFVQSFVLLMVAVSFHEFAHGWTANKLGDQTAKYSGRLTLNPLAHIDPFWTLLLPLMLFITTGGQFVFGSAKPVPINYWALKNPRRDISLVGASGPLANFILAIILSLLLKISGLPGYLSLILIRLVVINLVLGVFNLIPIPPLDGSRIVMGILPPDMASKYTRIEPYGFLILIVLMGLGLLNFIIWPFIELMLKILGISS